MTAFGSMPCPDTFPKWFHNVIGSTMWTLTPFNIPSRWNIDAENWNLALFHLSDNCIKWSSNISLKTKPKHGINDTTVLRWVQQRHLEVNLNVQISTLRQQSLKQLFLTRLWINNAWRVPEMLQVSVINNPSRFEFLPLNVAQLPTRRHLSALLHVK